LENRLTCRNNVDMGHTRIRVVRPAIDQRLHDSDGRDRV
jgi:hypothetical protein